MKLNSIRVKMILILIPLVIIPILLVGIAGTLFYRDVIRDNIWDDNLGQAKALSAYIDTRLDYSTLYLDSLASRPLVISDLENNKSTVLNLTLEFASENTDFDTMYAVSPDGTIVSSYPDTGMLGKRVDKPFVGDVTGMSRYTGGPFINETGEPVIILAVPVAGQNNTSLGTIAGEISTDTLRAELFSTQTRYNQYVYMVNSTGHIIVHSNRSFMTAVKDYSSVPAVREVMRGNTGIIEQHNLIENDQRLAAYSIVPGAGWGIVIAVPIDVAYQPIYESTYMFAAVTLALAAITALIAILLGNYLVRPITGILMATRKMADGADYQQFLPVGRDDELGELARSFDDMSRQITSDRARIVDEKNRAELYVDVMGHDINNLNQAALASLELIRDDPGLTMEERESIDSAMAAVNGSAGIIDNVRKIQRINEEKLDVIPEDLDRLLQASIDEMPRPKGKNVVINYRPAQGRMVNGNPLLKEAFANLIGNAIKYSGDEVTIDVSIERAEKTGRPYYDVIIADNGYGIPDDVKPRLFRRFQRGTTKARGKGLGLYIVRSLVEKLGGSVSVENRVPGDYRKGSKFIVSLPAREERTDGNDLR
ncbi:MAG: sensory histidine kinase CreC [Methanocella sp. PtaU1.Bin125]|nr:MAG: sensory histidine kinase CreC [Methanocella sp. PtaU1.Bin125]